MVAMSLLLNFSSGLEEMISRLDVPDFGYVLKAMVGCGDNSVPGFLSTLEGVICDCDEIVDWLWLCLEGII